MYSCTHSLTYSVTCGGDGLKDGVGVLDRQRHEHAAQRADGGAQDLPKARRKCVSGRPAWVGSSAGLEPCVAYGHVAPADEGVGGVVVDEDGQVDGGAPEGELEVAVPHLGRGDH